MQKKWITAMAVVVVGASLTAFALPQAEPWHAHRGAMQHALAQKLNLSDAQKQQLRALNKQFRQDNKAFLESFRQTRQQMRDAKEAGDAAKVDSLKATLATQRAQFKQLRAAQEPKILSILTPDQQAQYKALKAEAAARRQQRNLE